MGLKGGGSRKEQNPTEMFEQNVKLTEQNERLRRDLRRAGGDVEAEEHHPEPKKPWYRRVNKTVLTIVILCIVLFLVFVYFLSMSVFNQYMRAVAVSDPLSGLLSGTSKQSSSRTQSSILQKVFFNLGMRSDKEMQECQGPFMKRTFPDIDYALQGYNVLKGYPQAIGHDPGLTHPIFYADYSGERQTSDCRYSLPRGLFAVPDVSCVTSFKSEEITTSYQFSKSLAAQANVNGGGWGVSFSASAGYKQASSEMSTGQSIFVMSTASCKYYSTSLDLTSPPPFERGFLQWAERLLESSEEDAIEDVIKFVNYYGTHYLKEVTFGAKYIYQHKMSSNSYKTLSEKSFSVSAQASYSGLFSVGGGFSLDSSQSEAASEFSKSVETTTIAVGAPPPSNGDAMTWASTVKDTPVPVYYSMESIEELFKPRFMSSVSFDYDKVREKLENIRSSGSYCQWMVDQSLVDSCKDFIPGYELKNTRLFDHFQHRTASEGTCIEDCLRDKRCVAITKGVNSNDCFFYSEHARGEKTPNWKAVIFQHKIQSASVELKLASTHIKKGSQRDTSNSTFNATICERLCYSDAQCDAYEYCDKTQEGSWCENTLKNCLLFSVAENWVLEAQTHSFVKFIVRPGPGQSKKG